ncbi:carbohydrate kinase family protein [Planococcus sp. N028]|uniref:Carbohydrate kinase family protein n=1 Tax=Planococcus shixiaomingii TaxID=3058393 RepID=A0ABT8N4C6_9BACL|nr:carbohydrate kinase family protein [Planococcus sp. N028]MDN7242743.1 carbohydrate kinase family protein [Planococcus sp. N028]
MIGLVGNLNIDLILYHLDEQPKFGSEYVMENSVKRPGGLANVILPLSELGERPLVVSLLGNDFYGDLVYNELRPKIVDGIVRTESETSLSIGVVNQSSDRFFLTLFGNLTEFTYDTVKSDQQLQECSAVMFYGYFLLPNLGFEGTKQALMDAKKRGQTTFVDANSDIDGWNEEQVQEILKLLPHIDYFMPNEEEASYLTKQSELKNMIRIFKENGANNVIIKKGPDGSIASIDNQLYEDEGFHSIAVDTVGAGDSFDAGILYGFHHRFPPEKMLEFANALASIVVARSEDRYPDLKEIQAQIEKRKQNK